jgi:hypothetical protein
MREVNVSRFKVFRSCAPFTPFLSNDGEAAAGLLLDFFLVGVGMRLGDGQVLPMVDVVLDMELFLDSVFCFDGINVVGVVKE